MKPNCALPLLWQSPVCRTQTRLSGYPPGADRSLKTSTSDHHGVDEKRGLAQVSDPFSRVFIDSWTKNKIVSISILCQGEFWESSRREETCGKHGSSSRPVTKAIVPDGLAEWNWPATERATKSSRNGSEASAQHVVGLPTVSPSSESA